MHAYIDVRFHELPRDPAIETAIHRWVARLASTGLEIGRAAVTLERSGRRTTVCVTVALAGGAAPTAATSHADPRAALSDACRAIQRQLPGDAAVDRTPPASRRPLRYVA